MCTMLGAQLLVLIPIWDYLLVFDDQEELFLLVGRHVWQRLHGWKESLFVAGKEVIIKAIAQSIPSYVSSSNYH